MKSTVRTNPGIRQRGMTMIELLIALLIGLFLLGALITIVSGTRRNYGTQNALTQLLDNQRFAMSILNDVVQAAGYFPDPTVNTAATDLPAGGNFATAGQGIWGAPNGAAPSATPDTLSVQFLAGPSDTTINCLGGQNPSAGASQIYVNTFTVDTVAQTLTCSLNGAAPVVLASGVTNMQVLYGVNSTGSTITHDIDEYKLASAMTAIDWMNVTTVQITLSFNNPLYNNPVGSNAPQFVTLTRVIALMSRAGVTT